MSDSKILSIHVGQCGIRSGQSCWELFSLEHGILNGASESGTCNNFFDKTPSGKYVPNALFVDTDPSVINEMRMGGTLFEPDQLICSGEEGSFNSYAMGRKYDENFIDVIMNEVRLKVERFDGFQGFIVNHSASGRTGSGLTARIMAQLSAEYKSATKVQVPVYSSQNFPPQEMSYGNIPLPMGVPHGSTFFATQGPPVRTPFPIGSSHDNVSMFPYPHKLNEPLHDLDSYNAVFSTSSALRHADVSIVFENEALHNICSKKLGVERPSHGNMNEVAAHALSSATTGVRFGGDLNADLNELRTNLVPGKQTQFLTTSYAPFYPKENPNNQLTVGDLTMACFENANQTVKLDVAAGKYLAVSLSYRGDVKSRDVNSALFKLKIEQKVVFSSACPTAVKAGIVSEPPRQVADGCVPAGGKCAGGLSNNTAVKQLFERHLQRFDEMLGRKVNLHHYEQQGVEEAEFRAAREEVAGLIEEYRRFEEDADEEED